ncbi:MAG: hypothetical protein EXS52_00835 [Candidatus Staskawiczbacteria bacterium]|nr:hypothetical protein [Candidatus Staskawiczbacteria bacterium]
MIDNIFQNIEYCRGVVQSVLGAVYYSHIPTALVMLVVALLIYAKNRRLILIQILLCMGICFAIWTSLDLAIWVYYDNGAIVMFAWSLIEIFSILLFILSLYFLYVYIHKNDVSLYTKIIFGLLFLPVIILASTGLNLLGYDAQECIAIEGQMLANYAFGLKVLMSLMMLFLVARAFITSDTVSRKKLIVLAIGMLSFVFAFLLSGIIASMTENYALEIYGLLAIGIFIVALARLVVSYGEFNMKVFAAQILVIGLVVIVAAQFAFIQAPINKWLNALTTLLCIGFGWILIRSVKREIEQRKEITQLAEDVKRAYMVEKKAKEELERLDAFKDQFLVTTQHNLRTPLTSMMGYSDLLLKGVFGKQTKKTTEVIVKFQNLTQGMIKMVNDFLDMAQFQLGKNVVALKPGVDLSQILEDIKNELEFKANTKGVYLKLAKPEGLLLVSADREKLKAAIFNVIDNAVKYTVTGGVDVKMKTQGNVTIVITDTGIGIPKEKIASLFTSMFERGDEAKKVSTVGSGVGLYLSGQIIKSHNGKVWAESSGDGKGSVFYIELPLD